MKATYVKTKLTSVVNVSKIVTIHYYEFDKNFVFGGESHDFWEMVYIDKGRVRIRADETETDLAQGEIIFHRPNEFHSIRALDSSPNFFVISFVSDSPIMQHLEKHHAVLDRHLKPYISTMISEAERTFVIPKNDPTLKKRSRSAGRGAAYQNDAGTDADSLDPIPHGSRAVSGVSEQREHGKSSGEGSQAVH